MTDESPDAACVHIHEQNQAWLRDNYSTLWPLILRQPETDEEFTAIKRVIAMVCHEIAWGILPDGSKESTT